MGIELANEIKERMQALGLTYEKTADIAGISKIYIAKILQGVRNPEKEILLRLADALQMDRKQLLYIAYRDRAPEEAKLLFEERLEPIEFSRRIFDSFKIHASYVQENRFSMKFIDLVKKIHPLIKNSIDQGKDFQEKLQKAQTELERFLMKKSENVNERKQKLRLIEGLDELSEKARSYGIEQVNKRKRITALEFPLFKDEYSEDPFLSKDKDEGKRWRLLLDISGDAFYFAYQMKDHSMAPLMEKDDIVIAHAGGEPSERKPVIVKVKGKGIFIRKYMPYYQKKIFLTPMGNNYEDLIVTLSDIEWMHPVKGVYREIVDKYSYF